MSVPVVDRGRLELGTPSVLFAADFSRSATSISFFDSAASRDGQRFLIEVVKDDDVAPLTAVLNWSVPPRSGASSVPRELPEAARESPTVAKSWGTSQGRKSSLPTFFGQVGTLKSRTAPLACELLIASR
jgi:hypothetical protein